MSDCRSDDSCLNNDCVWLFDRVRVTPIIAGGTRVDWDLNAQFSSQVDPGPYTFSLEVALSDTEDSTAWTQVGASVVDTYYIVDTAQRLAGTRPYTHYRVKLETPLDTYYSAAEPTTGDLDWRDWHQYKVMLRAERVRLQSKAGTKGCLLKRKLAGTPCSCLDPQTEEPTDAWCESCYRTGIVGGYYDPECCIYAALPLDGYYTERQDGQGTVTQSGQGSARFLGVPQLETNDIWVDVTSDRRYVVGPVQSVVKLRNRPVVVEAQLFLLEFNHPVYGISVSE